MNTHYIPTPDERLDREEIHRRLTRELEARARRRRILGDIVAGLVFLAFVLIVVLMENIL
jgi:hypothetical protein